jgi:hypothetical protein
MKLKEHKFDLKNHHLKVPKICVDFEVQFILCTFLLALLLNFHFNYYFVHFLFKVIQFPSKSNLSITSLPGNSMEKLILFFNEKKMKKRDHWSTNQWLKLVHLWIILFCPLATWKCGGSFLGIKWKLQTSFSKIVHFVLHHPTKTMPNADHICYFLKHQ